MMAATYEPSDDLRKAALHSPVAHAILNAIANGADPLETMECGVVGLIAQAAELVKLLTEARMLDQAPVFIVARAAPDLLASLRELHDWMRTHTSAADTLEMLTRSHHALARADSE